MAKLMRNQKRFGRCSVKGHGTKCSVAHEIQSSPGTRTMDKRDAEKEIELQLHENYAYLNSEADPKCKQCHGRGYTGRMIATDTYLPCDCTDPVTLDVWQRGEADKRIQQLLNGDLK